MVMKDKKLKTLSTVSLAASIFPLTALIPVLLKIRLPEGAGAAWAGVNIVCAVAGLVFSIVCVRSRESRSLVNIVSAVLSVFWCLMIAGIAAVGVFLTFMQ